MTKKDILFAYYDRVLNLGTELNEEMQGYLIESLAFIYFMIPVLRYFSENNTIVWEEISLPNEVIIMTIGKDKIKKFTKELTRMQNEESIVKISELCDKMYHELILYIHDDKKESLVSSFSDYFEGVDQKYVQAFFEENSSWKYNEILVFLQKEQEEKNQTPCIANDDFLNQYPEFYQLIDKDGLVNISGTTIETGEYGVYFRDFFIYYSDIYSELCLGKDFLGELISFRDRNIGMEVETKILLDFNRIISKNIYRKPLLFGAYYFGVEFKLEQFFTASNKTLFSRKERVNPKFDFYFGNKIIYTDFYIDQINNSLLIEEVGENLFRNSFMNRLIHSEFDIHAKIIKHFDGSMLLYEKDTLEMRKSVFLSSRPKLSKSKQKLFRIDGKIDFESYRNILIKFFIRNELILEYFDINEYKETYKDILDYKNGIDY